MKGKASKLKLKPSARDKRRYLLVNCNSGKKVEDVLLKYLGVLGFARSAYMFVKKHGGAVVVSCLRKSLEDVKVGLGASGLDVVRVSGTLKGLGK